MKKLVSSKLFYLLLSITVLVIFFILSIVLNFECPLFTMFHIKCPFCGGRNMIMSLLRLDLVGAFQSNQLLFIGIPIVFLLLFIKYILRINIKTNKYVYILLIITTILFTVLRNIL